MDTPTSLAPLGRRALLAPALAALGLFVMAGCSQPQPSAPPAAPAPSLPTSPRVYASNETEGHVVVIDPASESVVARIEVGKRPSCRRPIGRPTASASSISRRRRSRE
jgi:YVTN family beta-propeller protein